MTNRAALIILSLALFSAGFFPINLISKHDTTLPTSLVRQDVSCNSEFDCLGTEVCLGTTGICTDGNCNGVCVPESDFGGTCSCEEPCPSGFTCSVRESVVLSIRICVPDNLSNFLPEDVAQGLISPYEPLVCTAPTALPTTDPVRPLPCIGADMLHSFAYHELVLEKHILARVLCDSAGSCATQGHIVTYNGKAMMMRSYCEFVGCDESIMEVNSPKYKRGLTIQSLSNGMYFTAFAARYETRTEEALLAAVIQVGL